MVWYIDRERKIKKEVRGKNKSDKVKNFLKKRKGRQNRKGKKKKRNSK
jgi:hypothetical protein